MRLISAGSISLDSTFKLIVGRDSFSLNWLNLSPIQVGRGGVASLRTHLSQRLLVEGKKGERNATLPKVLDSLVFHPAKMTTINCI